MPGRCAPAIFFASFDVDQVGGRLVGVGVAEAGLAAALDLDQTSVVLSQAMVPSASGWSVESCRPRPPDCCDASGCMMPRMG